MSFGNILGQLLQDGMGGRNPTRSRIDRSTQSLGRSSGVGNILGQLQGALGGQDRSAGDRTAPRQGGGFADRARDFFGNEQVGGMSGAQIGGLGAAAGAIIGGGLGGAARGGALAVLGTLALSALKGAGDKSADDPEAQATPEELRALTGPDTERLLVRAMIAAAKSDGQIDQQEMTRILGKLQGDEATAEERQFVLDEMGRPADPQAIAGEVANQAQAAEVYAASLVAIEIDSDAERQYLRNLASALKLDPSTVTRLHDMTSAPAA